MRGKATRWVVSLVLVMGCKSVGMREEVSGPIRIAGSTNVTPLARRLGDEFKKQNPKVTIDIRETNSNWGIRDTSMNPDFAAAIRLTRGEENKNYADPVTLGRDALCIFLHKSNTVPSINKDQLFKIEVGDVKKWSEVGGPDVEVTTVVPQDVRESLSLLMKYLNVGRERLGYFSQEASNNQAIEIVKGHPDAFATIGCSSAKKAAAGGLGKVLPIGAAEPTADNIAAGKLDIVFPLYLHPRKDALEKKAATKAFLEFIKDSSNVKPILKELDLAPPA